MKTKHTPGPWFNEDSRVFTVQGAHYVAETAIEGKSFTKRGEEAEANARLMATSPDLLQLLQRGLECGVFDDAPVFRADVLNLISKATGVSK